MLGFPLPVEGASIEIYYVARFIKHGFVVCICRFCQESVDMALEVVCLGLNAMNHVTVPPIIMST
jgi:hypothetical protein